MADNERPIIIKRKKVSGGDGHHGGAWKVAYADFVTAMMAFFLLMWLLGATSESQRKSIADYFSPTIPMVKASGGGSGAFGGESMFSSNSMPEQGAGASVYRPVPVQVGVADEEGSSEAASDSAAEQEGNSSVEEDFKELKQAFLGVGGEAATGDLLRKHIVTRLSDEGLVIELFDSDENVLFGPGNTPTSTLRALISEIVPVLGIVENDIAAQAHSRSLPIVLQDNEIWPETAERADILRTLLEDRGLEAGRVERVTGFADRQPITRNPMERRNDRLEIVVLRN